jgi:putative addiction module CopG family antidote
MAITLSPETQKLVEEKLKGGAYRSADEVVHAAIEALNELESQGLDEDTLDSIDRAEDQVDRGEVHDWNDVREQVRAKFIGE